MRPSWRPSWSYLGLSWRFSRAFWGVWGLFGSLFGRLTAFLTRLTPFGSCVGGLSERSWGSFEALQGRLGTIFGVASCPFGGACVAERCGQRSAKLSTMCSPNRFGKPSGNMWGKLNTKRKRNRKSKDAISRRRKRLLGAFWGTLGACWELPVGLLEASWGPPWACCGPSGASWGSLWPS